MGIYLSKMNIQKYMLNFLENPTHENYNIIIKHDSSFTNKRRYNLFLNECYLTYKYFNSKPSNNEIDEHIKKVKYIMDDNINLTAIDLDDLWILFYASKNKIYINRIKSIINSNQDILIKEAAKWSLNQHKKYI